MLIGWVVVRTGETVVYLAVISCIMSDVSSHGG